MLKSTNVKCLLLLTMTKPMFKLIIYNMLIND